jgi:S-formylglutathione hydrolase FrmB
MKSIFLAALISLSWVAPRAASGAGRVECSTVRSAILHHAVRYCALLPPSYDTQKTRRYPVLYFLHGLGQNEQALVESGGWALVDDLRKRGEIGEFLIVTPDAGNSFYINSRDGKWRYEDFFIREFIPAIDQRYRVHATPAARAISGVSMGGYGALRFAFKYPQLFHAVSAHSAALIEKPPATLRSSNVRLGFLEEAFGSPPDPVYWERSSPFTLARASTALGELKIYFDCGTEDDFGFDAGNRTFSKLLDARGVRHEFHLYPGGHGWTYTAKHISASLEFHSRAFGMGSENSKPRP